MQLLSYPIVELFQNIAKILFPPVCIICNNITHDIGGLCSECWIKIDFHCNPSCAICSHPFEYDTGKAMLCGHCLTQKPLYKKSYIVFKYSEHSKNIIYKFKYSDQTYLSPYLAKWLFRAAKDILPSIDILVPVPLHKLKLLTRLYNQSLLLAQELSLLCKVPTVPYILKRRYYKRSQTGLKYKERIHNIKNVLLVPEKYKAQIVGKKIMLIDDVITTSATINECTKLLLAAGASEVYVLALAKTILNY
ncbi:ComFC type amidophosphoribosyltransferase [Rickettsiales bacterium Ac37b]|nr:ComFC type amidophosphoribosyltransferase [Rickettsiales bacterium Ac37b]